MIRFLWSHCRNINVVMTDKVIKYSIPIYGEDSMIGMIKSIRIANKTLEIEFHSKPVEKPNKNL